ncbi:4272_t:CDS:2 [Paraglomus occultum]|uniref:4272_t:CDS:1 n=1 Tax=Paraglomus occultum TaxID=144539 RepID=A0A9N9FKZ4_9GLOM|nr:4272_t:CDS:2 [Paraglomus occultum]
MYGNVGLTTPRGSGTNGYVVRNLSYIRPRQQNSEDSKPPVQSFANRTPNKEILLHEQQRKTEIQLLKYKQELAEKNVPEEEAQEKLAQLRQTLLEKINEMPLEKNLQEHQTHQISEAKARENAKFARAFDIDTDNYVEGSAFDKEYQERKRKERVALREKEREERRKFLIDARDW